MTFTPVMVVCRKRCALLGSLFVVCLCALQVVANDFGLVNPAAKEFAEFQPATQTTGRFARKSSAFQDRSLPIPERSETIQQVSASEDVLLNPFSTVAPPMAAPHLGTPPLATQPQAATIAMPSAGGFGSNPYSLPAAQNNAFFYDPSSGYANPYTVNQFAQQQYAQQQYAQQQYAQQQLYSMGMAGGGGGSGGGGGGGGEDLSNFSLFAQAPQQYPQQYFQQYPHMDPAMNQFAMGNMYAHHGYAADPYGMPGMGYHGSQAMPDYNTLYQAVLFQEMARQQAEETRGRTSDGKEADAEEVKKQAEATWTLNNLVPIRVSSPLGETLLVCAKTISPFSTPTGPDKGVGMPLVNKSWLDHPWYFGGFVGTMFGSDLVADMIKQKHGGSGGLVVGYNFNEYWGLESRLHLASIDIYDTDYARQLFEANYLAQFPGMAVPPLTTRTNELTVLDAAIHYYPLGNAKWRPFFKYGLGVGRQKFVNTFGYEQSSDIVTMPLGVGVRYWWNERLALQADLIDNVVFASGIAKTQNNFAFTLGLTYSFGSGKKKHPVHYWPATPSMGSKW